MKLHADRDQGTVDARTAGRTSRPLAPERAGGRPAAAQLKRLQAMMDNSPRIRAAVQLRAVVEGGPRTGAAGGLSDELKSGIERLSGYSMDDVRVHYDSSRPAQLKAHAYAQGTEIHVAPGQERHVAHEAWHVVQQKQGRVRPTLQAAGVGVNDDPRLEAEADAMAARLGAPQAVSRASAAAPPAQRKPGAARDAVVELAYAEPAWGAAPAQLLANANVVVLNDGTGARVMKINFAERVPTTVSGGQGDHGIAEVLIHESISSLEGTTVYEFLKGLYDRVLANLDEETARHTSQLGGAAAVGKDGLLHEIATLASSLDTTPPENLQYLLSELTTKYWRLLEKRDMTAFDRKKGLTTGGGQERPGIDGLRRAKKRLDSSRGSDYDYTEDEALADAIGYTPFLIDLIAHEFKNEKLETLVARAATHVAEFLGIDDAGWVEELTNQLGYDYQVLKGEQDQGHFGLVAEGNTTDERDGSEVREFGTWAEAGYSRLAQGELIRITGHHPDISDRIFRVTQNYDPSWYEYPPDALPVEWINR